MGAETLLSHDLAVVLAVALMTMTIQSHVPYYFEKKVLDWKELRKGTRSRICVETAVIPSRIMLAYLTLPIVFKGFLPMSTWTPQDTNSALLACSILTGAYIIDLTVTRNNTGATVHHLMGPALLIWIRLSYSTFTPEDALMCRLLISFVFFGAIFSGSTTTALLCIFHFRKVWFKTGQKATSRSAYFYFTLLLPVLALSTTFGNFYCTLYLHAWADQVYDHFGRWVYVPLAWALLECSMQWKWAIWFFNCDLDNRQKFVDEGEAAIDTSGIWWLPRWRFAMLEILKYTWFVTFFAFIWRMETRSNMIGWLARSLSIKA